MSGSYEVPKTRRRLFLEIGLEERCNLECGFCFQSKSTCRLDPDRLNPFFKKLRNSVITDIAFCGGEPLLSAEQVLTALQQAKENGLRTTVITNGLLLTKKVVRRFASFLYLIQLPLDGADGDMVREMRGDKRLFKKTLENISLFNQERKYRGSIKIGVMVSAKNVHSVQDVPEVIWKRRLRIDYLKFTQFAPIGEAMKKADMFLIPEKHVLETVRNARNKRNYPFTISYSLMSDRTVPKLVLKADGQIYLGWAETTPICSMESFDALTFAEKYCHEISQIIEYNQLAFSSR